MVPYPSGTENERIVASQVGLQRAAMHERGIAPELIDLECAALERGIRSALFGRTT